MVLSSINPLQGLADFQNKVVTPAVGGAPGAPLGASPESALLQGGDSHVVRTPSVASRFGPIAQAATQANNDILSMIVTRQRQAQQNQGGHGTGGAVIARAATAQGMGPAGGWGGAYGLQKNTAAALTRLQAAYQQRWGTPLTVISGGRTHEEQAHLRALYLAGKGNLAAPAGTSVHETGRAVDFGGAAHGYTPQQQWLAQVAGQYGFSWTGRNFAQVEPWHFEYTGQ